MAERKRALITGITGQDGSYLAELLLGKGYEVHGIVRRSSSVQHRPHRPPLPRPARAAASPLPPLRRPHDGSGLRDILDRRSSRDEVYNLGAQCHVARQLRHAGVHRPTSTALGTLRLLEAIRDSRHWPTCRFYQASSSEMFGKVAETAADGDDAVPPAQPLRRAPRSTPTGMTVNYREAYGLFAGNGILFNHESPRRGETFVTRKITRAVAADQARACRTSSTSATSTPSATGASPATTSRPCG